jgi:FkbM family methyltransferase
MGASLADVVSASTHLDEPMVLVDVGCRWGFADTWTQFGDRATVIGFDADGEECRELEAQYADEETDVRLVPAALGAKAGPADLYVTVFPACSSVYPPNSEVMPRHPGLAIMRVERIEKVDLVTLDDWMASEGLSRIDALKLDTQGSELDILWGASRALESVRVAEVEVEFNRLYEGQPLFGDVDRLLREHGFELWRLEHLTHYGLEGADIGVELSDRQDYVGAVDEPDKQYRAPFTARGGQLYFADAYFVRSGLVTGADSPDWQQSLRDACIATAFGFMDLASLALERTRATAPPPVADRIAPTRPT